MYRQTEVREMFSYEPIDVRAGDQVVVIGDNARLRVLRDTLTTLPKGATLKIFRVQGPCLATTVDRDGKQLVGWVWQGEVEPSPNRPESSQRR
jgi:hypothetical protein